MIGYYVHHQGSGHRTQMCCIARHLRNPLTVLSSTGRPSGWDQGWIDLAPDVGPSSNAEDCSARGVLHWAPRRDAHLRARMARIAEWIDSAQPTLMIIDVSVEVAILARLLGVPVVVAAMRGNRLDRPHRSAYDLAEALLAPWPPTCAVAGWPARWRAKTWHVGAFSRFDGKVTNLGHSRSTERGNALVLWGSGGSSINQADITATVAATPEWDWRVLGVPAPADPDSVREELAWADVVICHGGQSAVAEVAAMRRPAIVVAQPRPHNEQLDTALALQKAGVAIGLPSWPDPQDVAGLLEAALRLGGERWSEWSPGDGAQRAALNIDELHDDLETTRPSRQPPALAPSSP